MTQNKPIIALCYDFDKTLSPKDMQEYTLLPKLQCCSKDFWQEASKLAKDNNMDKIVAYMKLIYDKANQKGIAITKQDFENMGKEVELFNGVDTWFSRINDYAKSKGAIVEHYVISAGLEEIISGTSIAKEFKKIFASSFIYNEYGMGIWPKQIVNYTTKTQYIFRINKGCINDLSDDETVNDFVEDEERRIPINNFIYIGDSATDIPAMKVVKKSGGYSIAVYNPTTVKLDKVCKLLDQDRIDYFASADYSEGSRLECLVKQMIDNIKDRDNLIKSSKSQKDIASAISVVNSIAKSVEDVECSTKEELDNYYDMSIQMLKTIKHNLKTNKNTVLTAKEVDKLFLEQEKAIFNAVKNKKEKI